MTAVAGSRANFQAVDTAADGPMGGLTEAEIEAAVERGTRQAPTDERRTDPGGERPAEPIEITADGKAIAEVSVEQQRKIAERYVTE